MGDLIDSCWASSLTLGPDARCYTCPSRVRLLVSFKGTPETKYHRSLKGTLERSHLIDPLKEPEKGSFKTRPDTSWVVDVAAVSLLDPGSEPESKGNDL